jgi:hypothetical protein
MSTKRIVFSMLVACAMVVAATATAQEAWTFDCGVEGWEAGSSHVMSWDNTGGEGKVTLTYRDPSGDGGDPPPAFDPIFQNQGNAFDMSASGTPYIIASFTATNVPAGSQQGGFYCWTDNFAEAFLTPISFQEGENLVVVDVASAAWQVLDGEATTPGDAGLAINLIRFDFPDGLGISGYENAVITIDWVALAASADYVPVQDTVVCPDPNYWDTMVPKATPTVDGVVDPAEYTGTPVVINNAAVNVNGIRTGDENTDEDISGSLYFAWDANNLYVGGIVRDNEVVYLVAEGDPLNGSDGIQICTDHRNAGGAAGTDPGVHIHSVVPGTSTDNNVADHYQHWPNDPRELYPNVVVASSLTADGYMVEFAIPWTDMNPSPPTPVNGLEMGYIGILMDFEGDSTDNLTSGSNPFPWEMDASEWPRMILSGPANDSDEDGLSNDDEILYGTDPNNPDTDGDGISDGDEVHVYGTNPLLTDSDGDGASDSQELFVFFTDPLTPGSFPVPAAGVAALLLLAAGLGGVAVRRMRK